MTIPQLIVCTALFWFTYMIIAPFCFPMPERTDGRALPGTGGAVFEQFMAQNK